MTALLLLAVALWVLVSGWAYIDAKAGWVRRQATRLHDLRGGSDA